MNRFQSQRYRRAVGFVLGCCFIVGCHPHTKTEQHQERRPPLTTLLQTATTASPGGGLTSVKHLQGVKTVPVQGDIQGQAFLVKRRTPELKRYPCQECHTIPLDQMRGPPNSANRAHWDVQQDHAAFMTCQTCHADGVDHPITGLSHAGGGAVAFDHAYQLCAKCHFAQARDWAGGAHGKRIGGWASPRVVKNCTGCHDPHHPKLEKRWPSRASSLPDSH